MTSKDSVFRVFAYWVALAESTHMGFAGLFKQAEKEITSLDASQLAALDEALSELRQIVTARRNALENGKR